MVCVYVFVVQKSVSCSFCVPSVPAGVAVACVNKQLPNKGARIGRPSVGRCLQALGRGLPGSAFLCPLSEPVGGVAAPVPSPGEEWRFRGQGS